MTYCIRNIFRYLVNVRLFYFLIIFRDLAEDKRMLGLKLHSGTSKQKKKTKVGMDFYEFVCFGSATV